MKSDILKFFDDIAAANKDKKFDYFVVVPLDDGVFIATNLGDDVIDSMPVDEITAKMKKAEPEMSKASEPLSYIDIEGKLH